METIFSAVVSDFIGRIISFVIEKYREPKSVEEKLERLQRVLLRIHTIVVEAQSRNITNEGMLLQLKMLMEGMYRGYFALDTFKYQVLDGKATNEVSHSFALSNINPGKRQRFATSTIQSMVFGSEAINELKIVLGRLESIIDDVQEFVILLGSYPRMFRQPYSTYLFVDNCMFGRQIERERIINFLLQKETPSTQNLSVLPIIGRPGVGKRTLVEHACNDERVRNYYSSIVRFSADDLKNKMLTIPKEDGVNKHQKLVPAQKSLFIIKFDCDFDEVIWGRFYSSVSYMACGSKIIITGTTEKITSFGTTQPLTLKYLQAEEYWYFFKTLAFGSADPEKYPKLASLAMEVATELKGSFMYANMYGRLLRANLNAQFWCCALASLRKHMQKNLFLLDEHPMDLFGKNHPSYHHQMGRDAQVYLVYNYYSTDSACIELPKVTWQDLITGNNVPVEEKFEVLGWKSPIPPYNCYIASCAKQKPQHVVTKKKRDRRKSICHS